MERAGRRRGEERKWKEGEGREGGSLRHSRWGIDAPAYAVTEMLKTFRREPLAGPGRGLAVPPLKNQTPGSPPRTSVLRISLVHPPTGPSRCPREIGWLAAVYDLRSGIWSARKRYAVVCCSW